MKLSILSELCIVWVIIYHLNQVGCAESAKSVQLEKKIEIAQDSWNELKALPKRSKTLEELTVKYKHILDGVLKRFLPMALKMSTEAKLSAKCSQALHQIVIGIRELKEWAVNILDSNAKLRNGFIDGTTSDFGDYDSCMSVSATRETLAGETEIVFGGQYCLAQFTPPRVLRLNRVYNWEMSNDTVYLDLKNSQTTFRKLLNFKRGLKTSASRMGFCIPSVCTKDDLQKGLQLIVDSLEIEVEVIDCKTKSNLVWKSEHVGFFTIVGVLIFLVIIGTIKEIYEIRQNMFSGYSTRYDCCFRFWDSFSLISSFKHLKSTNTSKGDIFLSMKGIRVLTMVWIVLTNCYFFPYIAYFYKNKKSATTENMNEDWYGILANPNPAIDSLFVISGILLSYNRGQAWLYKGENLQLWKCFIRKIFRFLPAMIFTIWLFIIFPILGDGPQWNDLVNKNVDICKSTWWKSLLFIQNYWNYNENCMMHTWFLALLVQYTFFSIVLVYLLYKKPFLGLFVNMALIVGTAFACGYDNLKYQLPPNLSNMAFDIKLYEDIMNKEHLKTYSHIGPFCIGLLLGCMLARRQKMKMNIPILVTGWLFCAFVFCAVLSGFYRFPYEGDLYFTMSTLYSATHRIGWALGVSWICLVCATGNGGFVQTFLSSNTFIQLDRLSYFVYLLNPLVIFYFTGRARETTQYGQPEMILNFIGVLVISFIFSTIAYLCFQYPLSFVEKLIFTARGTKKEEDKISESPDPEAILQMYNEARLSISSASMMEPSSMSNSPAVDLQQPSFKRRVSTVNFKETPEILNENVKRKVSNAALTTGIKKPSIKLDTKLANDMMMLEMNKNQENISSDTKDSNSNSEETSSMKSNLTPIISKMEKIDEKMNKSETESLESVRVEEDTLEEHCTSNSNNNKAAVTVVDDTKETVNHQTDRSNDDDVLVAEKTGGKTEEKTIVNVEKADL